MPYPTAADIENALKSASYWPTDTDAQARAQSQAEIAAAAVAAEWERLTGWKPFLMTSNTPSPRRFDATNDYGILDLRGAAQSVTALSVNDNTYVVDEQFWLLDAAGEYAYEPPYCYLRFNSRYSGHSLPGTISVTGTWGRVAEIPDDVFQACLQRAAVNTLRAIPNEQSVASISQDGFSKQFDIVGILTQKDVSQTGDKDFVLMAQRWMRVVC